jgi:hypothetical protein
MSSPEESFWMFIYGCEAFILWVVIVGLFWSMSRYFKARTTLLKRRLKGDTP